ncbi:MAG TPA: hypothetical protein VFA78_02960 [Chloroflexota bacterium]|nr:hypothetical protein [Chloroflexota bacterium]
MPDSMLQCYDSRSEVRMHLGHRLGVLIGGIGILAIIFILIAAAQRSPVFGKTAPTATATATPTPKPTPTLPPTATPRPTATPHPAHTLALSGSARITTDKRTKVRVLVLRATLARAATPRANTVPLRLDVRVENTGKHPASYSAKSFYVVSSIGATSRASAASRGSPPTGSLKPGQSVTLGLSFSIHVPDKYQFIWNDNNRLVPPARVGHYAISRAAA